MNGDLLAGNHTFQNLSHRIELGGVDKRVRAGVEERHEHRGVEAIVGESCARIGHKNCDVDAERQPRHGVEDADEKRRLDDVVLDLIRLGVGGARSRTSVAGHHACLATDDDQNASVATGEDGQDVVPGVSHVNKCD